MSSTNPVIHVEPYFGGFVLETLTIGMYGETRNAIREYIQNAFDSIQRAVNELELLRAGEGLIELELAEDSLVIRDNGAGLPIRNAAATLARVGASAKSHAKNAGFRGIGRLAGIVFANTVTFVTKAKGETQETVFVVDAKAMRAAMAPGKGSAKSAESLMKACVNAYSQASNTPNKHFFEVRLEGFVDPPDECKSATELKNFVGQIAPIPYDPAFPFRAELASAEKKSRIPIEHVRLTVKEGGGEPEEMLKRYKKSFQFAGGTAEMVDCTIEHSRHGHWWGWAGKKKESGAYTDSKTSGIRVRVRNIQIDGTEIFRSIFRSSQATYDRFQDWYVGEVFIDPSRVVPNARRDNFEEDVNWRELKHELKEWATTLGRQAYALSTSSQNSLPAQRKNLSQARKEFGVLKKADFGDKDRTLKLAYKITAYQKKIAHGSLNADLETQAAFRAISAELTDLKTTALSVAGLSGEPVDRESVQLETRDQLLGEIIALLEEGLSPECFARAKEILAELSSTGDL